MTDYLTAHDVAARLAVPIRTAYDILARDDLPTLRVGRIVRVHRLELERWIRCNSTSAATSGGRASTASGSRRGAATGKRAPKADSAEVFTTEVESTVLNLYRHFALAKCQWEALDRWAYEAERG